MYLNVFMMKSLVNLYLNKHGGRRRDSPLVEQKATQVEKKKTEMVEAL